MSLIFRNNQNLRHQQISKCSIFNTCQECWWAHQGVVGRKCEFFCRRSRSISGRIGSSVSFHLFLCATVGQGVFEGCGGDTLARGFGDADGGGIDNAGRVIEETFVWKKFDKKKIKFWSTIISVDIFKEFANLIYVLKLRKIFKTLIKSNS